MKKVWSRYSMYLLSIVLLIACSGYEIQQQKPGIKNVIFLIGDGMGVSHITAGMTVKKKPLNIERCQTVGLIKTHSASNYITDSGASTTAFATGEKTYNKALGVGVDSLPLKNIVEVLSERDYATGVVSTSSVLHATPAGFVAHNAHRNNYTEIALDFIHSPIDVFIGGGRDMFLHRPDSLNLIDSLISRGFNISYNLDSLPEKSMSKLAVLTAPEHNPTYSQGRGDMLPKATEIALKNLSQNTTGFFLMVEGSQIDWGGHDNDIDYIVEEMIDFDNAVGVAIDFAEKNKNTLVVITADHETGGLGINGGNLKDGTIEVGFTTGSHTGVMVPVFAYGEGAEAFSGIYDNTEIFYKILDAYHISVNE